MSTYHQPRGDGSTGGQRCQNEIHHTKQTQGQGGQHVWETTLKKDFDPFHPSVQPQHGHVVEIVAAGARVRVFVMKVNVLVVGVKIVQHDVAVVFAHVSGLQLQHFAQFPCFVVAGVGGVGRDQSSVRMINVAVRQLKNVFFIQTTSTVAQHQ